MSIAHESIHLQHNFHKSSYRLLFTKEFISFVHSKYIWCDVCTVKIFGSIQQDQTTFYHLKHALQKPHHIHNYTGRSNMFFLTKEFTFDYPMVVLPIVLPCFTAELIATCRVMSSALALALKHLALVGKSSGASASATLRKI